MPALLPQGDPLVLGVDGEAAGGAGPAVPVLPALEAVRDPLHRDVLVPGQGEVTHPAAEVLQVPEPVLGCRVLRGEDELVTGLAPGDLHLAGEVSPTVQMSLEENSVFFINYKPMN